MIMTASTSPTAAALAPAIRAVLYFPTCYTVFHQNLTMIRESLTPSMQLAMDLAQEMGASSWLTTFPQEERGFTLHKSTFRDAMALRYGWIPSHIPSHCVCDQAFSVQHTLSCLRGGFPLIRHNELHDLIASLLKKKLPWGCY